MVDHKWVVEVGVVDPRLLLLMVVAVGEVVTVTVAVGDIMVVVAALRLPMEGIERAEDLHHQHRDHMVVVE